jgi:hypothetical protein
MTRGIATPLLAVGPGQVLTEGRFYASIGLPDDGASSLTFRSTVLTLTLTEY